MELQECIRTGDVDGMQRFMQENEKWSVNSCLGRDGFSLLHWACHFGALEVVQWLLWSGADSNLATNRGWTCGHIAAIRGHSACLEALSIYKCDLSATDERGATCLHLAAAHGRTTAVEVLLRAGLDFSATDMRGWTPAHHTAYHGQLRTLLVLKRFGAPLHDPDVDGNTPAHFAGREGHLMCLQTLVLAHDSVQAVLEVRNDEGDTPKTLAIHFQKQDCVDYLSEVERNAKLPDFYHQHDFPAHSACYHGNLSLLIMLIDGGHCGINDQDVWGATPAHKAAGNGHVECLQWLIDNGADLFIRNKNGETAKDVARKMGQVDCLAVLGGDKDSSSGVQEGEAGDDEEAEELAVDGETKERALKRVQELLESLAIAKGHLKQCGGVSEDDLEQQRLQEEHQRVVEKLQSDLESERVRREGLEMQVDRLTLKLHQTQERLDRAEELLRMQLVQTRQDPSPSTFTQSKHTPPNSPHRKAHSRAPPDLSKGAYIKVNRSTVK